MELPPDTEDPRDAGLLMTLPILDLMRTIEGWLEDGEADLLIATAAKAVAEIWQSPLVVEIGSYYGRSTVVLGSVLKTLRGRTGGMLYAIDPHTGEICASEPGTRTNASTFEAFWRNIARARLADMIVPICKCSFEVEWNQAICCLFIDGLHDYENVARDFHHFEPWLAPEGYVAFHDYANYYPGVQRFVAELEQCGRYRKLHRAGSMIVLRKKPDF